MTSIFAKSVCMQKNIFSTYNTIFNKKYFTSFHMNPIAMCDEPIVKQNKSQEEQVKKLILEKNISISSITFSDDKIQIKMKVDNENVEVVLSPNADTNKTPDENNILNSILYGMVLGIPVSAVLLCLMKSL
jgi:hypothetical protein